MTTYGLLFRLARFRPAIFILSLLTASIMFYVFPLIPGLIVRQLFDDLTGHAQAGLGVSTLVALIVATGIARATVLTIAAVAENSVFFISGTLLRRNMLERILQRPGARAVPYSAGESISRF